MKPALGGLLAFVFLVASCTEPVETDSDGSGGGDNQTGGIDDNSPCQEHAECNSRICGEDDLCVSKDLVIYVATTGSADETCGSFDDPCSSIQTAVDNAHQGLTAISIAQGTYDQQIKIRDKKVEIVGHYSPTLTFTGTGNQYGCTATGDVCVLRINDESQVTLSNIILDISTPASAGLGIWFSPDVTIAPGQDDYDKRNSYLRVEDSKLRGKRNSAPGGGGVLASYLNTILARNTIENGNVILDSATRYRPYSIKLSQIKAVNSIFQIVSSELEMQQVLLIDSNMQLAYNFWFKNDVQSLGLSTAEIDSFRELPNRLKIGFVTFARTNSNVRTNILCDTQGPPVPKIEVTNSIVVGPPENRSDIESDCVFENSLVPPNLAGSNNFFEEPGFVDSAGGDFKLLSTSPAIDRLRGSFDVNTDFEGDPRPYGEGYDVGADEYVPASN